MASIVLGHEAAERRVAAGQVHPRWFLAGALAFSLALQSGLLASGGLAQERQDRGQAPPASQQLSPLAEDLLRLPEIRGAIPDIPGQSNTTVIERSPSGEAEPGQGAGVGRIRLVALLTEDGQQIEQGLVWRVFEDAPPRDGKSKLISAHREPSPTLQLKPGSYIVNAAFGRANLTRKIVAKAGERLEEQFVLNAGGLRLEAVLDKGQRPSANTVAYDIFSDERDQFGNRRGVMTGVRPSLIIRLNAGIYHVVSTYGGANAKVETDVTVEAGKLTQLTVKHAAARVTFKLVGWAGGDAIPDTQWTLQTPQGEPVARSVGALPSHILAPGTYVVVARSQGRTFRRSFAVQGGDVAQVELVIE